MQSCTLVATIVEQSIVQIAARQELHINSMKATNCIHNLGALVFHVVSFGFFSNKVFFSLLCFFIVVLNYYEVLRTTVTTFTIFLAQKKNKKENGAIDHKTTTLTSELSELRTCSLRGCNVGRSESCEDRARIRTVWLALGNKSVTHIEPATSGLLVDSSTKTIVTWQFFAI
jgi:hypothetical protein